jgi:hypothetical protein
VIVLDLEERDRWEREHADGGLPAQSWRYCRALAHAHQRPKLAVVRAGGARMLLPFFERSFLERTDIATTLGLSGASISPPSPAPLIRWREHAQERGWVAGYVQLAAELDPGPLSAGDRLAARGPVFLVDLGSSEPLGRASRNARRNIRAAIAAGAELVEDRRVVAEALVRLYPVAMRRLGAGSAYDHSSAALQSWAEDPNAVVLGARIDGALEAAYVFAVAGHHAESQLLATTERGRGFTAWLIWHAVGRLQALGVRTLNLGGGMRRDDGLETFKRRLGARAVPLRAVHQIYDEPAYRELCRRAGVRPSGAWFPAYRMPQTGGRDAD